MAEIRPEVLKTLRLDTLNKINQGNKRTHTFNVDFSDVDPTFVGTFTVHHPSQMERLTVGATVSNLLGGNLNVDTMTYNIATIVATLDVVLDNSPEWFNPYSDSLDYEILEKVYLEYSDWLYSFRRKPEPVQPTEDSENGQGKI